MVNIIHHCNGKDGRTVHSEKKEIDEGNSTLQVGSCYENIVSGEVKTSTKRSDDKL